MNQISNANWKQFHIYDLFEIDSGTKLDKVKMKTENPTVNFVGRSSANNGVTERVEEIEGIPPFSPGYLTLALGGAYLGSCFVQKERFYTSQNVVVLIPKFEMTLPVKQFIATAIFRESQNNYCAFIKELNAHIKRDFVFSLPVNDKGELNTCFIEEFMSNALKKTLSKFEGLGLIKNVLTKQINDNKWLDFPLVDLFDITGSTTTPKGKLDLDNGGNYPYITTAATNNGVGGFSNIFTEDGGVITVDSAVAGTALYQEERFTASDHVEKLIPKFDMSKNIALFIVTILNRYAKIHNYAYNEKRSQKALKEEIITLPSKDGKPDFAFMDSFIDKLFASKRKEFDILLSIAK